MTDQLEALLIYGLLLLTYGALIAGVVAAATWAYRRAERAAHLRRIARTDAANRAARRVAR